ncbi:LPXTG-motif cell wall-anchored protein [Scopulibacillus darangshiensis]|uniref:LPXTG-motif cell wall-anchored protein n=1 Tax=Scopulibacillus darangshiensis TaxID=442528 RepID=A0A4R2P5V0_9BACL|nr:TasA family protein [Scopulibacillus darangshiensis]TCP30239.1 LPXTG-motif cell wall-anchored protein [Scopulibacillus darangshiensis]
MKLKSIVFKLIMVYCFLALTAIVFLPLGNTSASKTAAEIDLATTPQDYLFNVNNMKPGDWATRTLTIHNKGNKSFNYNLDVGRKSGSEKLFDQLIVKIEDQSGVLYQGGLKDFKGFESRSLQDFDSEDLTFTVKFPKKSGNEYQGLVTDVAFNFFVDSDMAPSTQGGGTHNDGGGLTPVSTHVTSNTDGAGWKGMLPQTGESNPLLIIIPGVILTAAGIILLLIKKSIIPHPFKRG